MVYYMRFYIACPTIDARLGWRDLTSEKAKGLPDYEGAKAYAVTRLEQDLSPLLYYHSLWHTRDEVASRSEWLAEQEGLSSEARVLVGTAAYFHDIG